jgi:nitric oxide reductase NorQ protein
VEELYYSPSLRETIAFAKLLNKDLAPKEVAEIVFANAYDQWGEVEYRKVMDMITSIFGN